MIDFLKQQMTRRLAFTLVCLGLLGGLLMLRELDDQRRSLINRLADIQSEITVLSGSDNLTLWTERRAEAAVTSQAWQRRHWTGRTPGIASASAQPALRGLAQESGLENIQLTVSSDLLTVSGQELLRFDLAGRGDSAVFSALLVKLATFDKIIVFTEIEAPLRDGALTRISIGGYLPYLMSPQETE